LDEKVKQLVAQAVAVWKQENQLEIETLRAEIIEVKTNQAFICNQYDDLKNEYDNLLKVNNTLKTQGINETMKVDELDQYGRRQNLEIVEVLKRKRRIQMRLSRMLPSYWM